MSGAMLRRFIITISSVSFLLLLLLLFLFPCVSSAHSSKFRGSGLNRSSSFFFFVALHRRRGVLLFFFSLPFVFILFLGFFYCCFSYLRGRKQCSTLIVEEKIQIIIMIIIIVEEKEENQSAERISPLRLIQHIVLWARKEKLSVKTAPWYLCALLVLLLVGRNSSFDDESVLRSSAFLAYAKKKNEKRDSSPFFSFGLSVCLLNTTPLRAVHLVCSLIPVCLFVFLSLRVAKNTFLSNSSLMLISTITCASFTSCFVCFVLFCF